jgi:hypothetical protein
MTKLVVRCTARHWSVHIVNAAATDHLLVDDADRMARDVPDEATALSVGVEIDPELGSKLTTPDSSGIRRDAGLYI